MKLIIQVPCYNEAETLSKMLQDIPKSIQGIDIIETLVVDDGSTDDTYEIAKSLGVDHIIRLKRNRGLANAFAVGIDACLRLGADIVVNTDADNQYRGGDISALVQPVLKGQADFVLGNRNVFSIKHFSLIKKVLQRMGTKMVGILSDLSVEDATSGFRALSREACMKINVLSRFTYTLETIIEAGNRGIVTTSVDIGTNPVIRDSRLFKNIPEYLARSVTTILRVYATYKPLRVFIALGLPLLLLGMAGILRWLYFWLFIEGRATGHIQTLQFGALFTILGIFIICFGIIADLISTNRQLLENMLYLIRKMKYDDKEKSSPLSSL
ncbi:MAG: glycosyltransferase family 2 protein [Elusimicrobiota bacterium]